MEIRAATAQDIDLLAKIVSESNRDVALLFNLTTDNAPKHPSFCKPEWIRNELERGQKYFIYVDDGRAKGCVAYEQPDQFTSFLNRLSVLPNHRRGGIGSRLVNHIIDFSHTNNVAKVSIGIIAEYTKLVKWYQKRGFTKGMTQKFDHLPFDVLYMQYSIQDG